MKTIKEFLKGWLCIAIAVILMALILNAFPSEAQTITYNKQKITYTKKGDIQVLMNDAKKTVLYFKGFTSMPTATQVLAEYKRVISANIPPVVVPPVIVWDIYTPENLAKMGSLKNVYVKIKPGTYTGQYSLNGFNNVTIDLSGSTFSTWNTETFILNGETNGLHFINGNVKNTNRSFVSYLYLGATFLNDITFDNMVLDNTGPLFDSQGGYKDSPDQIFLGVINNFKVKNTVIKNSPNQGTFVTVKGDGFLFDNLKVDNVAINSGQHAHILILMGRGTITNSKLTNHRGSFERLTPFNLYPDTSKKSYFTNNIVDNSTRYGAFEVFYADPNTTKLKNYYPSAVYISNNTVGRLGFTDKTWENTLVDIYDSGAPVYAYKNLTYQMYSNNNPAQPSLINYASRSGSDPTVKAFDNKYFQNWQDAINIDFSSKYPGYGATIK